MSKNIISDKIFTISVFFSPEECKNYIELTEQKGYADAPVTTSYGAVMMPDIRNNERVMYDDADLANTIWQRLQEFIPSPLEGGQAIGLNERFRFYRYDPGQRFSVHMDGHYERHNGDRSLWTFMIYLNEGFEGGQTMFYSAQDYFIRMRLKNLKPSSNNDLVTSCVQPVTGTALLFRHELPHEGMPVVSGRKYVLRTDVMYSFA